ncbi:tetratricopeptide repeat protein [Neobacillus mesonae]|nr:tetratricopeptide repeat protein [Neobacillus mesonae]
MKSYQYIQKAYKAILQGDYELAVHWFETAIAEEPNNAELHYRCSITYARNGKLDQALLHAKKAAELAPDHSEYLMHVGSLEAKKLTASARVLIETPDTDLLKVREEVLAHLKQSIALDPLYTEAYVWLAIAYAEMDDYILAIAVLKEAISLEPQNEQLTQLLQDFHKRMKSSKKKPST